MNNPIAWFGLFHEMARYIDNEFYRDLLSLNLTRYHISVLAMRRYDETLREHIRARSDMFKDANGGEAGVGELTFEAWTASQELVELNHRSAEEHQPDEGEAFYELAHARTKVGVDELLQAARIVATSPAFLETQPGKP